MSAASKKRRAPAHEKPATRLTANWYDAEEISCMQRTCVRRGMEVDAVRAAIERDRSGDGVGVFATLAASCVEDVGLASPMSLSAVLVSMAMWEADTAAGKHREARAHMAAAVASVASWPKSRLVADAAVKTMEVDLDALVARMTTDMAFEEIGGHTLLTDSVAWGSTLAEPLPSARRAASTAALEAGGRIDAQRAVATFGALVRVACEVWSDGVAPADITQDDEAVPLSESSSGGSDEPRDTAATEAPHAPNGADGDGTAAAAMAEDAAALAEGTTLTIEEGTLALVHILIAMQDIEGRRVEWPPKGPKAPSRPPFIDDAMRSINAEAGSPMARNCWPTLCGAGARDFFSRPVAWAFGPLLAVARSANCERAVMALLGLAEALARGLIHARPALVAGVLMTVRHSTLAWDERRIDVQSVATRPDIAAALGAYDVPAICDLTVASLSSSSSSMPSPSGTVEREAIAAARPLVVDPERHLDGTTSRHAGCSTADAIPTAAAAAAMGLHAADMWTPEEVGKSHGPALSESPSDARLAAGVAEMAPRCAPDQMAESYPATDDADAATRVRVWADKGDAAARDRHSLWARTLRDQGYAPPPPPKRPLSSSKKRQAAGDASTEAAPKASGEQQQQEQEHQPQPKSKPAPSKRRRDPATPKGAHKRPRVDDGGDGNGSAKDATASCQTAQMDTPLPAPSLGITTDHKPASSLPVAAKRGRASARSAQNATLTAVYAPGSSDAVDASRALDLLRPGRLLRIVHVVYEEVDPSCSSSTEAMDVCDVGVRLLRQEPTPTAAHGTKRSNADAVCDRGSSPPPLQTLSSHSTLQQATQVALESSNTSTTATGAVGITAPPRISKTTAPMHDVLAASATTTGTSSGGASAPSNARTAAASAPTRSRSRAAEALTPCPDLVARLSPKVLSDETVALIKTAPLAQKPTLTTKKCVYMLADGAYKGPYAVDQRADVVRVVRTLYRERVMRDLWGDSIVAHHEPVFDPHARVIYLRMDLVGDRGPDGPEPWTTVTCAVKRGRTEHNVDVVNRDSHGLVIINTMEWLGSQNFVDAFANVVVHMAARYLIDGGDANLNNIIGCPRRGAASVTAVDIEDNRNCSNKKRKKAKKPAPPQPVDDAGDGDEAGETAAPPAAAPPTLMRCLFSPGRGPKADEQPTFDALLREHMGVVRDFTERVRESLKDASPDDIVPGAADYARDIGYYVNPTVSAEVPTCGQIGARLDVLEACLDQFEGVADGGQDD
ncbi:Bdlf3-like domain-containing protein [Pandoravirus kuranda]|uniref:Bdlf3-like domain-containing protein n=1 Tax=Pandoravirus kuranda TaxID=3019033 RepID=A0AA95EDH1_9VIRU|nr:Bdlf3-like domain-containing protein [Pandoravirus kuranda]